MPVLVFHAKMVKVTPPHISPGYFSALAEEMVNRFGLVVLSEGFLMTSHGT